MEKRKSVVVPVLLTASVFFALGWLWAGLISPASGASDPSGDDTGNPGRVFELRTYTVNEGRMDDLHRRFRDHTLEIFEKHGMDNVGYWVPLDPEHPGNTLIFIISHRDRDTAEKNWEAFRADPEWQKVAGASNAGGMVVRNVESVFMNAAPYSPIK